MGRGTSEKGLVNENVFFYEFLITQVMVMDCFQLVKRFFVNFKVSVL